MNVYKCPHIQTFYNSFVEIKRFEKIATCFICKNIGPNLWICMQGNCLKAGCSEQANDHSTEHFKKNSTHCVHMNLSSQRIWCYLCEKEVFVGNERNSLINNPLNGSDSELELEKCSQLRGNHGFESEKIQGLVGLQNIANTCYMNSALQALSNIQPLTYYFLDCGDIVEHCVDLTTPRNKAGLAKSYHRLIKDIWRRTAYSKDYVAPRGILYGIRSVHSMFRGFQQHDTQEFLRCFMDQLHEELKEVDPVSPEPVYTWQAPYNNEDELSLYSSNNSPSQSEGEYETCDSGVSEQSSLFEDSIVQNKQLHSNYSYAPGSGFASSRTSLSICGQYHRQINCFTSHSKNNESISSVNHRSIISDIFDGKLLSSVQCLTCDRISTREETFQDLSLPIPNRDYLNVLHQTQNTGISRTSSTNQGSETLKSETWMSWLWNIFRSWMWGPSVTLHDCMASFFSADELKGDNMYSCEKCNKLRTGVKYSRILHLPEALCIHLKRFRHDLSYSSKISSYIHFPLDGFDMRPYLHKECKSNISLYNLASVICHHGTVGSGHYTCYAKNEIIDKWYEFDDQHVKQVTPEIVQDCQAYVLFYRKHNPKIDITRAQARELSDLNPPQFSDIRFFVSKEWINRFNTFAEPGPINNWAILCPHGGLSQLKVSLMNKIAVPISQPLWDFFYRKFGGGPAINTMYECEICKRAAEILQRRQRNELTTFTKHNDEFQNEEDSNAIFAISMPWFRKWQLFARGITHNPPGPINNSSIAGTVDGITSTIRRVKPGSDYAQLNTLLWKFFYNIYGGGPKIILRGSISEETSNTEQLNNPDDTQSQFNYLETIKRAAKENSQISAYSASTMDSTANSQREDLTLSKTRNVTFETDSKNYEKCNLYFKPMSTEAQESPGKPFSTKKKKILASNYTLKKRTKRSRNAMKSAGFFGPKGNYNANEAENNRILKPGHSDDSGKHNNPLSNNTFQRVSCNDETINCLLLKSGNSFVAKNYKKFEKMEIASKKEAETKERVNNRHCRRKNMSIETSYDTKLRMLASNSMVSEASESENEI